MENFPWFGRRLGVVIATSAAALLAGAGEVYAAGLSCTGLPAAGAVTSNPIACTVTCSAGGTLASAVALKPRTTNRLTITIKGTCVASTDDLPGGITLQGSTGAILQAPSATTDPVLGISGTGVELDNLTISGGVYALRGHSGSAFTGTDLIIEKASIADILLNHSVVTLNTSTIESSANDGIDVQYGGTVFLNGGTVQKNAADGIHAADDGSAEVYGGAVLQTNGVVGAIAYDGGSIYVSDAKITNNGGAADGEGGLEAGAGGHIRVYGSTSNVVSNLKLGIGVYRGGSFVLDGGATVASNESNGVEIYSGGAGLVRGGSVIQGNGGDGIYVESGEISVGDPQGPATIQLNKGDGVFLRTNSVVSLNNSSNKITDNAGWGILCTAAPSNPLIFGTVGTVFGNGKGQVSCKVSP